MNQTKCFKSYNPLTGLGPPTGVRGQAASVCDSKGMKLAQWADLCPKGRGKTASVPQLGASGSNAELDVLPFAGRKTAGKSWKWVKAPDRACKYIYLYILYIHVVILYCCSVRV